jgi:hypothetical protein
VATCVNPPSANRSGDISPPSSPSDGDGAVDRHEAVRLGEALAHHARNLTRVVDQHVSVDDVVAFTQDEPCAKVHAVPTARC